MEEDENYIKKGVQKINLEEMYAIMERHRIINKLFEEGKEIPEELTKNFVTFPISNNPFNK